MLAVLSSCGGDDGSASDNTTIDSSVNAEDATDSVEPPLQPIDPPSELAELFDDDGMICPSVTEIEMIVGPENELSLYEYGWDGEETFCSYDSTTDVMPKAWAFVQIGFDRLDRTLEERIVVDASIRTDRPELGPDVIEFYRDDDGIHECHLLDLPRGLQVATMNLSGVTVCPMAHRVWEAYLG
jgi:hypothetical protein